jgi:hypothetical protein
MTAPQSESESCGAHAAPSVYSAVALLGSEQRR